jgi:hypothetical protein
VKLDNSNRRYTLLRTHKAERKSSGNIRSSVVTCDFVWECPEPTKDHLECDVSTPWPLHSFVAASVIDYYRY